jgi:hypothetical protein
MHNTKEILDTKDVQKLFEYFWNAKDQFDPENKETVKGSLSQIHQYLAIFVLDLYRRMGIEPKPE